MESIKEYAIIKDGKIYQSAFLNFPEREIGLMDEANGKNLDFYTNNFSKFEKESHELIGKIESNENKGSFLSHVINLLEKINKIEGVGDYESIYKTLKKIEVELQQQIIKNRERNYAVKKAFIEEIEAIINSNNSPDNTLRIIDIQKKWIKVGAVDKDKMEEVENHYKNALEKFFQIREGYTKNSIEEYKKLIAESEEIKDSNEFEQTKKKLIDIQQKWKTLPHIPKADFDPLKEQLTQIHNHFFSKLSEAVNVEKNKKSKAFEEKTTLKKETLIREVQDMLKNIGKENFSKLKNIQEEWKKTPTTKSSTHQKMWEEFCLLCDEVFEKLHLNNSVNKYFKDKKIPETEVLKFQIDQLKKLISQEKNTLKVVEENLGSFRLNISSKKVENMFLNKDKTTERKIAVREKIIKELREKLNDLVKK